MVTHPAAPHSTPPTAVTVPSSDPAPWRPLVSVVLPIRNEADHIEACLERLLEQDYPRDRLEYLVVDGASEDGTRDLVRRVQARHPDAVMRLIDNPARTVSPGLNAGIRAATGEVIVRMDGHTVPAADYVSACVAALRASGAANAGGVIEPRGATPFGRAVAVASAHRLGAGDARYRVGGEAGFVETVPFGAFRREVFARTGLFDESLVRNQDYEMNVRIHAAGERVYLDPAIRSVYTPRGSARKLWDQYFQYGWWRVETLRRHPRSLRWRQLVPPAFVAGMGLLLLAAPLSVVASLAAAVGLVGYLAVVVATAARVAPPTAAASLVAACFLIIHLAFGAGFLASAASGGRFPFRAQPPRVPSLAGDSLPGVASTSAVVEAVS